MEIIITSLKNWNKELFGDVKCNKDKIVQNKLMKWINFMKSRYLDDERKKERGSWLA